MITEFNEVIKWQDFVKGSKQRIYILFKGIVLYIYSVYGIFSVVIYLISTAEERSVVTCDLVKAYLHTGMKSTYVYQAQYNKDFGSYKYNI